MVKSIRALRRSAVVLPLLLSVLSCELWFAPESPDGRSGAPAREILVVHSLAETLSSIELAGDGSFLDSFNDIVHLGSIPNAIIDVGYELVVTLSGENRLLFLDGERLFRRDAIDLGTGVNPMQTTAFGPGSSVFATTGLFSARVHLYSRDGTVLVSSTHVQTGLSPHALLVLPETLDAGTGTVRLLAANTAYSTSRPSSLPFGPATLSVFTLSVSGTAAAPRVAIDATALLELERENHNPETESGLNPVALMDMQETDPAVNEVLVIGSGINYGSSGAGEEDGTLLVLDRTSLNVKQRISMGGSPGAAVVMERDDGGLVLLVAGTTGIWSVQRLPDTHVSTGGWDETSVSPEYRASGGLPFLADIVALDHHVYVADFGNDQVLRFHFDQSAAAGSFLSGPVETRAVSDGPVTLLIRDR